MRAKGWIFVDAELAGFAQPGQHAPDHPMHGASLAIARVGDYGRNLLEPERVGYQDMAPTRKQTYSTGRYCAHLAVVDQAHQDAPITRDGRVPRWPNGLTGSITHTSELAAAVVSCEYASVGIDLEQVGRVTPLLYNKLFTAPEIADIKGRAEGSDEPGHGAGMLEQEIFRATCMFSAKEAAYKAVYQIAGQYIGFQEARVTLEARPQEIDAGHSTVSMQCFTVEYLGQDRGSTIMSSGRGVIYEHMNHVMTYFVVE